MLTTIATQTVIGLAQKVAKKIVTGMMTTGMMTMMTGVAQSEKRIRENIARDAVTVTSAEGLLIASQNDGPKQVQNENADPMDHPLVDARTDRRRFTDPTVQPRVTEMTFVRRWNETAGLAAWKLALPGSSAKLRTCAARCRKFIVAQRRRNEAPMGLVLTLDETTIAARVIPVDSDSILPPVAGQDPMAHRVIEPIETNEVQETGRIIGPATIRPDEVRDQTDRRPIVVQARTGLLPAAQVLMAKKAHADDATIELSRPTKSNGMTRISVEPS